jgi:hypothetical protein
METPCFRRGGRRHGSQAKSGSGGQCHCCFPHAVLLYFSKEWECLLMSVPRKELPKNGRPEALALQFNVDEKPFRSAHRHCRLNWNFRYQPTLALPGF